MLHILRVTLCSIATATAFFGCARAQDVVASEKARFKVEVIADGLSHPWGMVKLPDGRFLVTERPGRLRVIENGKLLDQPVDGLPPLYHAYEGGLLDIELHPDYAKNGWIYFTASQEHGDAGVTGVFRAKIDGMTLKDVQILFTPPDADFTRRPIHFGSRLTFDDKGHFYFSIGDRGETPDAQNPAQNLGSARGKIHRLNDDGTIPRDNPFVDKKGALPSIWSYGHRNPQGLRFQPGTGLLWESEHGPRGGDELNIIKPGANYGWPLVTFGVNDNGTTITDKTAEPGMEDPVWQWTPSIAVSGIGFYNGDKFPAWKGNLFAAALNFERLVRSEIDENHKVTHQEVLLEGTGRMRDVRFFDDGSFYLIYDDPGQVVRLVPAE
ncbi:MAG: PQQ-dependent sugar dehydrogenase [Chthoniobacterales bacterium]